MYFITVKCFLKVKHRKKNTGEQVAGAQAAWLRRPSVAWQAVCAPGSGRSQTPSISWATITRQTPQSILGWTVFLWGLRLFEAP